MVRRINMSQINSKIRQAQHRAESQIRQAQRKMEREIKHEIQKSVNQYKREVSSCKRRIQSELRKLETSTNRVNISYVSSVQKLNQSYNVVDDYFNTSITSNKEQEIFNYIENENANSLSVANAIESPETIEIVEIELQDNGIGEKLSILSLDLNDRWKGALFSLNPSNPDATRHFCTSTREIFTDIFDKYALDKDVFEIFPDCEKTDRGNATRKSKIKYFLYKKGINIEPIDEFIDNDIQNILELYHTLSNGTHGKAGRYTIEQLKLIKKRVEDGIKFLCEIVI